MYFYLSLTYILNTYIHTHIHTYTHTHTHTRTAFPNMLHAPPSLYIIYFISYFWVSFSFSDVFLQLRFCMHFPFWHVCYVPRQSYSPQLFITRFLPSFSLCFSIYPTDQSSVHSSLSPSRRHINSLNGR